MIFFPLSLSFALGFFVLHFLKIKTNTLIHSVLSINTGLTISSFIYYLYLNSNIQVNYLIFELFIILFLTLFRMRKFKLSFKDLSRLKKKYSYADLLNFFLIILLCTLYLLKISDLPYGSWDAFSIWNLHAKFLINSKEQLRGLFFLHNNFHPDYPLLLPLSVAKLSLPFGKYSFQGAPFIGLIFFITPPLLLIGSFSKTPKFALLSILTLFANHTYFQQTVNQCADVPLSVFLLLSFFCFYRFIENREKSWLILSMIFLISCSWTKNEGVIFILIFLTLILFFKRSFSLNRNNIIIVITTAFIFLPVLIYFKIYQAPENDLINSNMINNTVKLFNYDRHIFLIKSFVSHLTIKSNFVYLLPGFLILVLPVKKTFNNVTTFSFIFIISLLGTYYCVYLITPHDISWHVNNSINRLLIHPWALLTFITFVYLKKTD